MSVSNPSIEDLPEHVLVEILSRLPVKTIIHCKCVCKKWLDLVSDSYFANLHLSRSPAGIMIHQSSLKEDTSCQPGKLKWVEVEDEPDHHHLHRDPVMSLDLNLTPIFQESKPLMAGSVDGLLCLLQYYSGAESDNTYICNPITREYMILSRPDYYSEGHMSMVFCFGVSSATKEYKVIKIFEPQILTSTSCPSLLEAEVYTLGTGQWRSIGHVPYRLDTYFYGPFLNGHAHWMVVDEDSPEKLCTFDFDKETFELFPSPPVEIIQESQINFTDLAVLKGCLCQCDIVDSEFRIWVMKEYGIKKSWHKEVVIKQGSSPDLDLLMWRPKHLIEHLHDGTILMVSYGEKLLAYSCERRTIADTDYFDFFFTGIPHRLSFLKLRDFESEVVHFF